MANNNTNKMNIPSTISAGAGAIGSLFGLFTQNKANKDNMRFQRQENERNRNFQREMADYAYQKNLEQWNRENEYNSPIETRKRLKNAGLNPDLFYGGGAGNMVSADSPMMSAPSGTGGVSPAVRPISADTHALDLEMRRAQIDNIKSQTEENLQNAGLASTRQKIEEQLSTGYVELQSISIRYNKALADNAEIAAKFADKTFTTRVESCEAGLNKLIQDVSTSKALQNKYTQEALGVALDNIFKDKSINLRIQQLAYQNGLTYAQTRASLMQATAAVMTAGAAVRNADTNARFASIAEAKAPYEINLMKWDSHIKKENLGILKVSGKRIEFDFEQAKNFEPIERTFGLISGGLGLIDSVLTILQGGSSTVSTRNAIIHGVGFGKGSASSSGGTFYGGAGINDFYRQ